MAADNSEGRSLLKVAALRENVLPRPLQTAPTLGEIAAAGLDMPMSRRHMLGLAGAAAVTASPLSRALSGRMAGPVEYSADRHRVVFRLGGQERWVIDTRRFAGAPKLHFERTGDTVHLALNGARFPGTELPADFTCDLSRGLTGWTMKVQTSLGGFRAEVPFERWLSGSEAARGHLHGRAVSAQLGEVGRLRVESSAEAEFRPDWTLRLTGTPIARLELTAPAVRDAGNLRADAVVFSLLASQEPSLLESPQGPRALVCLERGKQKWTLHRTAPDPAGGEIQAQGEPFDVVRLEFAELDPSRVQQALVALAEDGDPRLAFVPRGLTGADGDAARLPLAHPRYAVAFDHGQGEKALMAGFAEEPVWVQAGDLSVQVGSPADASAFEVFARAGKTLVSHCVPALLGMAAPLAGALVSPARALADTRVELITDGDRLAQNTPVAKPAPVEEQPKPLPKPTLRPGVRVPPVTTPATGATTVTPGAATPGTVTPPTRITPDATRIQVSPDRLAGLLNLEPFTVQVTRTADLLSLTFRFANLVLKTEAGKAAVMQRSKPNEAAYLVVQFPPQHVGEEAILEKAAEISGKPDNDGVSTLPGVNSPVQTRLSGTSRLVFKLPASMQQIPYTLEALLDWTQMELSVAPNALPPPIRAVAIRPGQLQGTQLRPFVPAGAVPATGVPRTPTTGGPATRALPGGAVAPATGAAAATGTLRLRPDLVRTAPVTAAARTASDIPTKRVEWVKPGTDYIAPAATGVVMLPSAPPRPAAPDPTLHTAIEAPYRLILSPHSGAGWVHALQPVTRGTRTELWHTRLGVKSGPNRIWDRQYAYEVKNGVLQVVEVASVPDPAGYYRTLRAIWSPDWSDPSPARPNTPQPFRMSLDKRDRSDLVTLTSDFQKITDARERVVEANRVMLSSLGAWLDVHYGAPKPIGIDISLIEWVHQATMGRDQYVKVVYKGYLFPFGNTAALVKVTERKFEDTRDGSVAYLRQRYFIVVRQPVKDYPAFWQLNDGRQLSLRKVRIKTLVTPTLDDPANCKAGNISNTAQEAFWPKVNGKEFEFHMVAEDSEGHPIEFTCPLMFIESTISFDYYKMAAACNYYNKEAPVALRDRDIAGQSVALAEGTPGKEDTSFETTTMRFGAEAPPQCGTILNSVPPPARSAISQQLGVAFELQDQPLFYPTLPQALVRVPAITNMIGQDMPVWVALDSAYVNNAWDTAKNAGEVFLRLVDDLGKAANQGLMFPTDKSGGMLSPDVLINGLSRSFGPVGGALANIAGGQFDPSDFFSGMFPKLFGCVDLVGIIMKGLGLAQVPGLTTETQKNSLGIPERLIAKYNWSPKVSSAGPFEDRGGAAKFTFNARAETPLLPGPQAQPPLFEAEAKLETFALNLFDLLIANFKLARFYARTGMQPDVDVDLEGVEFGGALTFVNELKDVLKSSDLGGLSIDPQPTSITAAFSITLPSIGCGVMSIQNIRLGAALTLSYLNDPVTLRFNFSEKADPFIISVGIFGGGGFFGIEVVPDDIKLIEAAFEFGGNMSMDIGVASGGIHLMAGIYFKYVDSISLTAYVRCGGSLSVLGLITISAEFYLGMTYESEGNRLYGTASLEVEIEILFFSFGVTLTVERQFAGSSETAMLWDGAKLAAADDLRGLRATRPRAVSLPRATLSDVLEPQTWATYCAAFA